MSVPGAGGVTGKPRGVLLKSLGFSLVLILVFTLAANLLPQVEGEAPVEKEIELGALTMAGFIALGEELFEGKGTCALCHNAMGRAPDILAFNMVSAAQERLNDARYAGGASDAASYLHESMVDPSIYVVAGFGKKGTNDAESPMPAADKPPIELTAVEMDAVIAFLQAKDGNDVTVSLPTEVPTIAEAKDVPAAAQPARSADEAIAKFGCRACHMIQGEGAGLGPALDDVGVRLSKTEIRQSILDPNAIVAQGYPSNVMPQDYAAQMTVQELEMLVKYLAEQKE